MEPDLQRLDQRLTNLELLFTHLERQVAELNQVVLRQARTMERLGEQVRQLRKPPEEERDGEPVDDT